METLLEKSSFQSYIEKLHWLFLDDPRTQGSGKEYASGLAEYCLGILIKERPEGENLTTPFKRHRECYGRALYILKDFPRPLANLIASIIRFSLNNFENGGEPTGYWARHCN